MKWISNLWRKPVEKSLAATPVANPPKLVVQLAPAIQEPLSSDPPSLWVVAINTCADKTQALRWLSALSGDVWLGEVAAQSRFSEVRLAAAQRIEALDVLERTALLSRDKDKRVYRYCSEILRQRREADAKALRAAEWEQAVHALLEIVPLPHSRFVDLEKEMAVLESDDSGKHKALLEQARARLQQESAVRRELNVCQNSANDLLQECSEDVLPEIALLNARQARLEDLLKMQSALPDWLATHPTAKALQESLRLLSIRQQEQLNDHECLSGAEQFLAPLVLGEELSDELIAGWRALPKPKHLASLQSLQMRWQSLLDAVAPAPAPLKVQAPARAIPVVRNKPDFEADELRSWARWGTEQAREHLIEAAAALLTEAPSVDELAAAVPKLREEWKRLNVHSPASREQWERFQAILEQAYQPVAARYAEELVAYAAARAVKEAFCAEWTATLASVVWEQVDYKALEVQRETMITQWRAAPVCGPKDERLLRKQFDALLATIDPHLEAVRAVELARRKELIAAAEALLPLVEQNINQSTAAAKLLQERWLREAGPLRLPRYQEQKLWTRFRAACDAIFTCRDALRAQQAVQRAEQKQAKESLLEAFAARFDSADAGVLKQSLAQFRTDWNAQKIGAKEASDSLEKRARDLQQQAQRRIEALLSEKQRIEFDSLAQKAALVEQREAAATQVAQAEWPDADVSLLWSTLPPLPEKFERVLSERLANAPGLSKEALLAGRALREVLMLDLEITLALPSPEAQQEARRRRQLERLQNRFGGEASLSTPDVDSLILQWYAVPAQHDEEINARMSKVLSQQANGLLASVESKHA